jgi:hypothetical protein
MKTAKNSEKNGMEKWNEKKRNELKKTRKNEMQ